MADFEFLHNPYSKKWVIFSPRRAKRPDEIKNIALTCPFCPGREANDPETYRFPQNSEADKWQVRVVTNKYPFAPIHEVLIHSPDHHKNFDELPLGQSELVFRAYRERYNALKDHGNVVIFHNFAHESGASVSHPHSQIVVTPKHIDLDVASFIIPDRDTFETKNFILFCPKTAQWPDEVWIVPKNSNGTFGDCMDDQLNDLSFSVARLIQIMDIRHGHEFSFNFYISPWTNWYLRFIPRVKKIGGFELATGIFVNTQDPSETIEFIKEHFENPVKERIIRDYKAEYHKGV